MEINEDMFDVSIRYMEEFADFHCYPMHKEVKEFILNVLRKLKARDLWVPIDPNNLPIDEVLCLNNDHKEILFGRVYKDSTGKIFARDEAKTHIYNVTHYFPKPVFPN
jgi:hypothetical protein